MLKNLMVQFYNEEDGAGLVEYLIIIAIAAIVAALLFPVLRKALVTWFNNMIGNINSGLSSGNTGPQAGPAETVEDW